jgi:hypothetical protein
VWWGITFGFLLFWVHFLILSLSLFFILSFYVCDSKKIGVCEMGEIHTFFDNHVKKKYNGF